MHIMHVIHSISVTCISKLVYKFHIYIAVVFQVLFLMTSVIGMP